MDSTVGRPGHICDYLENSETKKMCLSEKMISKNVRIGSNFNLQSRGCKKYGFFLFPMFELVLSFQEARMVEHLTRAVLGASSNPWALCSAIPPFRCMAPLWFHAVARTQESG